MNVIPIRTVNSDTEFLRCSHHPLCEGPHLRADHDDVCNGGAECDDELCWRGCPYCIADKDVQ